MGRDRALLIAGSLLASSGVGVLLVVVSAGVSDLTLGASALTLLIAAVAAWRYAQTRNLLDPLILISGAIAWYFAVHLVWVEAQEGTVSAVRRPFGAGLDDALLVVALGYVCLVAAYLTYKPKLKPPENPWRVISATAILIVFAAGMTANLYGLRLGAWVKVGDFGTGGNIITIRTAGHLAFVAFVVATVGYYRGWSPRWISVLTGLTLATFGVAVGHKMIAFEVGFAWLVARNVCGARIRPGVAVAAVLVFMFLVTPILQSGRTETIRGLQGGEQAQTTLTSLPTRAGQVLTDPASMLDGWEIINRRTNGIESVSLSILYTERHEMGLDWAKVAFAPIPSEVWPGKPVGKASREFSLDYGGVKNDGFAGLTLAPTVPGDMWVQFGLVGVLLGMAGLGLVLRWLGAFVERGDPVVAVPIFATVLLDVLLLEVNVAVMLTQVLFGLVGTTVALVGLVWLTGRRVTVRSPRADSVVIGACLLGAASIAYLAI